ncbi:MAG: ABC transporter ATP-binding protein [SAR324 cluster bacterium]|nr:ABC transporter ATP-binding protein [SAR324 cluster bacterium]
MDNINFNLERGTSLGVVGESGCGKSMMALAIMGLLPDNMTASGEVQFGGNLLCLPEKELCQIRGNRISMVFQEPMSTLNPLLPIGFQVAESLRLHKNFSFHQAQQHASKVLDRVGLQSHKYSRSLYPHQLSGGQRQRVVIAIAMACGPELIIADEPTTALDVTIQAQILDLIAELVFEENMSLILITHNLGIVAENTDHMLVMYAGNIVESGPTKNVFEKLVHPYTRGLFSSIPNSKFPNTGKGLQSKYSQINRLPTIPGRVPEFWERSKGCSFVDRCPRAQANCSSKFPEVIQLGTAHSTTCFFPYE